MSEQGPETRSPPQEPTLARELPAIAAMALLFLVSIGLALAVAPTYLSQNVQAFEDPQSLANPLYYLAIVVVFTVAILAIAKWGPGWIIQAIFLLAVFATLIYVLWPLLNLVLAASTANLVAFGVSGVLIALLYLHPEWYVIDIVGVAVAGGAAAIFGISFGLLPSLLLLVAFAVYDAIAVYRTKHMLDLADNVLTLRLPIMLVVPKTRGYSFLEETRRFKEASENQDAHGSAEDGPAPKEAAESEEAAEASEGPATSTAEGTEVGEVGEASEGPEAMFMGLGDIVIPGVLVVSAATFLQPTGFTLLGIAAPMLVALATLLGIMLGFTVLMGLVLTGRPQAGLPTLNGGAILLFLVALLTLYGLDPLVAPIPL